MPGASNGVVGKKRSFTGHHTLLPAANADVPLVIPLVPSRSFASWTFGRGTAIWRIWPAVLLHTAFAAIVVSVSLTTNVYMGIPSIMLTVLGVVIGFVLAYRVSSGYDRYWMGRSSWGDIIRNARTMGRLIWFHIPARLANHASGEQPKEDEIARAMREKQLALDLVQAFAVATKHHLRGELGIYYEDLYSLVKPLHAHPRHHRQVDAEFRIDVEQPTPVSSPTTGPGQPSSIPAATHNHVIKPINTYGSTNDSSLNDARRGSWLSRTSSASSDGDEHRPLLPGHVPTAFSGFSRELLPFSSTFHWIGKLFHFHTYNDDNQAPITVDVEQGGTEHVLQYQPANRPGGKHRPLVAGGGTNLPVDVLRCLSEWMAVIEVRGTGGVALGGMFGCLSAFEDALTTLEKILTTPLPFAYSAHIRHTVWLYLFFLPFQLVESFSWYGIPGTCLAAFFYLGFLAAAEEIEQPFGYDENDLDIGVICREIIAVDISTLRRTACPNSPAEHLNISHRAAKGKKPNGGAADRQDNPLSPPEHTAHGSLVTTSQLKDEDATSDFIDR